MGLGKKTDPKPKLSVLGMAVMVWVSEGEASVTGGIGDPVGGKQRKRVKQGRGREWRRGEKKEQNQISKTSKFCC